LATSSHWICQSGDVPDVDRVIETTENFSTAPVCLWSGIFEAKFRMPMTIFRMSIAAIQQSQSAHSAGGAADRLLSEALQHLERIVQAATALIARLAVSLSPSD
jgi:hypothetical protein